MVKFFFICVTPKFSCSFFVCVKELVYNWKYLFVLQPQTVCVKKLNSKFIHFDGENELK